MRKIAIINQKGGVGKTTTAVNLSAGLARAGQRVCLADMDPQAHASLHLGLSAEPGERSMYDVLVGNTPLAEARRLAAENLSVVGSHIDVAAVEIELAGLSGRELVLRDRLAADSGPFDYWILDCPPSLGVLTLNALAAVDEVFIPLQPHFLALHGLGKLLETISLVASRINPRLQLTGVVLCMHEATKLAAEVARDVSGFLEQAHGQQTPWSRAQAFATRIRRNIRLAEAPSFGQSIFDYAPDSPGAEDYARLAGEVLAQQSSAARAA
jgi:chromosome partitioning protein